MLPPMINGWAFTSWSDLITQASVGNHLLAHSQLQDTLVCHIKYAPF